MGRRVDTIVVCVHPQITSTPASLRRPWVKRRQTVKMQELFEQPLVAERIFSFLDETSATLAKMVNRNCRLATSSKKLHVKDFVWSHARLRWAIEHRCPEHRLAKEVLKRNDDSLLEFALSLGLDVDDDILSTFAYRFGNIHFIRRCLARGMPLNTVKLGASFPFAYANPTLTLCLTGAKGHVHILMWAVESFGMFEKGFKVRGLRLRLRNLHRAPSEKRFSRVRNAGALWSHYGQSHGERRGHGSVSSAEGVSPGHRNLHRHR